ncbi:hypothetical protein Aspvir_002236 [Aspergillus viridinutans]|uniref:Uncharacterized protein n=1 Tax=Aspergillus viridinutans TaxID=75553 RepID=A0A9P3C7G6_ASPVI|nr:uncharacterized protein Aspvir_002236 [Aspergillus viridinutans]GIK06586.1 hypothetical protein Aspvir_002236 [Aspergillus viridinutans]
MLSQRYTSRQRGQSCLCHGTSYRARGERLHGQPDGLGHRLDDFEDKAAAVSDGVSVIVGPDVDVVMEELVEDISFTPDGSAGLKPMHALGREIPLISIPSTTASMAGFDGWLRWLASMAGFAGVLCLVHPGSSH